MGITENFSRLSPSNISKVSIIAYAYLILLASISYIFPIPDTYRSIIAQPGLVIIPFLVGKPFLFIIRRFLSIQKENNRFVADFIITWSLGVICITALEIFLYVNYLFSINSFVIILLLISTFSLLIKDKTNFEEIKCREFWLAATYGLLFSLFITKYWNYPYANANDYIQHAFYTVQILENNHPSVFYSGYFPTMYTLYAILMWIFNVSSKDAVLTLWSSRFILYPIYTVGFFLLSYKFFNNRLISLIVAIIGTSFINGIESSILPWHTAPKNIVGVLFILALYLSLYYYDNEKNKNLNPAIFGIGIILTISFFIFWSVRPGGFIGYGIGYILLFLLCFLIISIKFIDVQLRTFVLSLVIVLEVLIFFHKSNGYFGAIIILIILFLLINLEHANLIASRILALISIITASIIFLIFQFKIFSYPAEPFFAPPYSGPTYMFGWDKLLTYLSSTYPFFLILLFLSGSLFAVVKKDKKFLISVSIAFFILVLYFLPIYFSYRFLIYLHPFVILLSVQSILMLVKTKNNRFSGSSTFLFLSLLVLSIGLSIYTHDVQEFDKANIIKEQKYFQIFEVGDFIKDNIKKDAVIVGYMWHQQQYAYYGQVNPVNLWKKGLYDEDVVKNIYLAETSEEAYKKSLDLLETKEYFVSDPDPYGKEINRFYRRPSELILVYDELIPKWHFNDKTNRTLSKFFDNKYFDLLFVAKNVDGNKFYVFRVKINGENNHE